MKPSTLKLHDLTFLRIHVDVDMDYKAQATDFDFNGMKFQCDVRHGQTYRDAPPLWWVGVEFANASNDEKRCPYVVEVKAAGLFTPDDSIPEERREAFVYESGAAMVYGAIREMLSTLTGRAPHGPLVLPSVSFFGSFEDRDKEPPP